MRRSLRSILVGAATTMMVCGLTTAPAQAASTDPVWRNIHPARSGNLCLDSGPAGTFSTNPALKDRGNVYINPCNYGNKFQQWRIVRTKAPGNPLQIRNMGTQMCLDGEDRWPNTDWIYTFECSATGYNSHQLWDDMRFGGNLRSPGSKVLCLTNQSSKTAIRVPFTTNTLQMFLHQCDQNYSMDKQAVTWFSSTVN